MANATANTIRLPSPAVRETLHCPHCALNQFITATRLCRRCHQSLDEASDDPVTVNRPDPDPVPDLPVPDIATPLGILPAFRTLDRTLPVILLWFRLRLNLTQPQLGRLIGVTRNYISRIETGITTPTLETISRWSVAMDVSMPEIFQACEYLMNGEQ